MERHSLGSSKGGIVAVIDRLLRPLVCSSFVPAPELNRKAAHGERRNGYLDEDSADGWVRVSSIGKVKRADR